MRKFGIWLLLIFCLAACDRAYFYTTEAKLRASFYAHEDDFIALANALDAHPYILTAQNCPPNVCNYHNKEIEGWSPEDTIFAPYLDRLAAISRYIFFQRGSNRVLVIINQNGGQTGDFRLRLDYVYWPKPDKILPTCSDYSPPGDGHYYCIVPLKHGWMIEKSGLNQAKIRQCTEATLLCHEAGNEKCNPKACEIFELD